jgi:hypothetical protein
MSSDLAERFEVMQIKKAQLRQSQDVMKMSFEELGRQVILFGEAKKGQRFSEVVANDPNYCKWFLKKSGCSPKQEHQIFNHYLMQWIERQELEQAVTPPPASGASAGNSPVCPKAKAQAGTAGGRSSTMTIDLETEEEEWWDHLTPPAAPVELENAKRLDQIEGVLSEVIGQLKLLTQQKPSEICQ